MNNNKICVSVAGNTMDEALEAAKRSAPLADVIEIRLDTISAPDTAPFINTIQAPILFTNRAQWEGGNFGGSEKERTDLLVAGLKSGASYVDIELKTESHLLQELIKSAKGTATKSIVSWHSFTSTPSSQGLQSILQEQYRSGADIGKIVSMANNFQDVLRVLDLQILAAELSFPLIAFCMGQAGVVSRIATLGLGGFMTYASADSDSGTAPGQLPVSSLKKIMAELKNAV